jgi:hypothetical protein
MSEDIQQDAAELAKRSRSQAKNSAKNAGRAVKAVAEPVVDATAEEIHDTAQKLEGTARTRWRRFVARSTRCAVPSGLERDLSGIHCALSGSIYAGTIAYGKFAGARAFLKGYKTGLADLADQQID